MYTYPNISIDKARETDESVRAPTCLLEVPEVTGSAPGITLCQR